MKKIVALVLALMLALSVALSASAETELKIYLFGEAQNMDKVLEKFYADSGLDIKLNIVWNTGADHREKMPLLIGNEETCDLVFDAYWMNMSTMISQEMYADLSSYFNNDEYPGLKAAFSESYLAQVTDENGAIYAIPFTHNTFFMFYDKTLLDEADVATLEGIMAKETGDNVYNFYFESAGGWKLGCYYYGAGLSVFGPNGDDQSAGCDWNSETGIAVTEYLIDLINNPKCAYDGEISVSELIAEHRLGAWFDGSWNYDLYKDILGDDLGLAVIPTFNFDGSDHQLLGFYGSKCIGVNAHSQNTAAAVAFATYLGNEENQLLRYELSAQIPAHEAAGNSEAVQSDPLAAVIVEEANTASIMQPVTSVFSAKYWNYANTIPTEIRSGLLNKDNVQEKMDAFVAAMETE